MMGASSNHTGGVQVSLMDGSVRFMNDSVQTQNLHLTSDRHGDGIHGAVPATTNDANAEIFSYGVWSELGAINDGAVPQL